MLNIDSLTFDLVDCSLQEQSELHRGWMNSARVAHMLRFSPGSPNRSCDLTQPDETAEFYGHQCAANGGVMLSNQVTTAAGVEALSGVFKYRAPLPGSLAMYYVGILWLPFQECSFQVNIEAMEHGTTGTREAAVMVMEGAAWPQPTHDTAPVILKSADELFERLGSAPVRKLPSDDERYDHMFPNHPLSQVRGVLAKVVATARLNSGTDMLTPFRVWRS